MRSIYTDYSQNPQQKWSPTPTYIRLRFELASPVTGIANGERVKSKTETVGNPWTVLKVILGHK